MYLGGGRGGGWGSLISTLELSREVGVVEGKKPILEGKGGEGAREIIISGTVVWFSH